MGFTLLGYNHVANYHKHITPDGKIISHSHPNNDSKGNSRNNHNHTNIQFVNFDNLSHQFTVTVSFLEVDNYQSGLYSENTLFSDDRHSTNEYLLFNQFRAPPLS